MDSHGDHVQLRTERCLLRRFAVADREPLAAIANDRRISRNLTDAFPYPYSPADADEWIEETGRHDPPRQFAIEVAGELVSGIGVNPKDGEKRHVAAVGYWLASSHWGRGLATEALTVMVDYIFEEFPHRRRVGDEAEFRVHDLAQPLSWLEYDSFDAAVVALVIHHVDDRRQVFREIHRVLKPGGHVVISTHHPTMDWLRTGGSYFAEGMVEERWKRGWDMRHWRMPLSVASDEMTDSGLLIERIVEPRAVPELAEIDPEHYETLMTEPRFICFRLVKPS